MAGGPAPKPKEARGLDFPKKQRSRAPAKPGGWRPRPGRADDAAASQANDAEKGANVDLLPQMFFADAMTPVEPQATTAEAAAPAAAADGETPAVTESAGPTPPVPTEDAGGEKDADDDAEDADDGAWLGEGLEGDLNKHVLRTSSAESAQLLAQLSPAEYERFETFLRTRLDKAFIVRLAAGVLDVAKVSDSIATVLAGVAKVYVGELTELALEVQRERGDSGPLLPEHVREGHRRLQRGEHAGVDAPCVVRGYLSRRSGELSAAGDTARGGRGVGRGLVPGAVSGLAMGSSAGLASAAQRLGLFRR